MMCSCNQDDNLAERLQKHNPANDYDKVVDENPLHVTGKPATVTNNLDLPSKLHCQSIVVGTCAKTINQNVIEGLHVWQLAQKRDHVRGSAHITKLT